MGLDNQHTSPYSVIQHQDCLDETKGKAETDALGSDWAWNFRAPHNEEQYKQNALTMASLLYKPAS
jgi:hypothetical protein